MKATIMRAGSTITMEIGGGSKRTASVLLTFDRPGEEVIATTLHTDTPHLAIGRMVSDRVADGWQIV